MTKKEFKELYVLADIREIMGDPTGKLMLDELVEKIRELKESTEWQPIETAPKGRRFIAYDPDYEVYACLRSKSDDMWLTADYDCAECYPTHWLPLPEPPKE